jgi:hypothetical protein
VREKIGGQVFQGNGRKELLAASGTGQLLEYCTAVWVNFKVVREKETGTLTPIESLTSRKDNFSEMK